MNSTLANFLLLDLDFLLFFPICYCFLNIDSNLKTSLRSTLVGDQSKNGFINPEVIPKEIPGRLRISLICFIKFVGESLSLKLRTDYF